jgi:hypothetical protein
MRVFVLCTGRNGSTSFAKACQYSTNYTAGHETKTRALGDARFDYPDNHIEADNRMSWFLGEMNEKFGDTPYYIHLKRDFDKTVNSFMNRWGGRESIIEAYCEGMKMTPPEKLNQAQRLEICKDYVNTVTINIDDFLSDKSKVMEINIENIKADFPKFWEAIGAEGDLEMALKTFDTMHNASPKGKVDALLQSSRYRIKLLLLKIWRQFSRG